MRNKVRRENVYTEKVIGLIREAFDSVSPENWARNIHHVQKEENDFWKRDKIIDADIEPIIIALGDDDECFYDRCGMPEDM